MSDRERVLLMVPVARDPYEKGGGQNLYHPHLGLAYLASSLESEGATVEIFDGVIHPSFEALAATLDRFRPTHVGLTAFTVTVKSAARTAAFVRERLPGVPITVGGPHTTGAPVRTLEEFEVFDHAIAGEGEGAYRGILDAGERPEALVQVGGIAWRGPDGVVRNPDGPDVDLDALPFPGWHHFDLERYHLLPFREEQRPSAQRDLPVMTFRGCPFRCTYCSHSLGFKVRKRSVGNVVEELRWLVRDYGATSIFFLTETFTLDRAYTWELCDAMIEAGIPRDLYFGCCTRVDTLDPELIAHLRRAGCSYLSMGLESGTQDVLDSVERGHEVAQVERIVRCLQDHDVAVHSNFMMGLPGETPRTILRTIDLSVRLKIDYASFCVFMPYPGAALTAQVERSDRYRILSHDWDEYRNQSGRYLVDSPELSERQIRWLHLWAYARFYGRWGYWQRVVKMVAPRSILIYSLESLRRTVAEWARALRPSSSPPPGLGPATPAPDPG